MFAVQFSKAALRCHQPKVVSSKMKIMTISSASCPRATARHFMSSMTVASPDEENHFALILGKPGGGKGTISGKILQVRLCRFRIQ
jgi:hypothetical protein